MRLCRQEQCRVLAGTCKDFQTLKYKLGSVVERSHAVTAAQSVQHNPEDIQRALTRVSVIGVWCHSCVIWCSRH